jgi:hypothetical protein
MHPDDQPPAPRKPPFPNLALSIFVGMLGSLAVSVSGAQTYTPQWWAIVISAALVWITLQVLLRSLMRWALASFRLTITPIRDDDPSI